LLIFIKKGKKLCKNIKSDINNKIKKISPTKIIIKEKIFKDKTNKEKFVKNSFFKKILIK
jgi:hypothetical protein